MTDSDLARGEEGKKREEGREGEERGGKEREERGKRKREKAIEFSGFGRVFKSRL